MHERDLIINSKGKVEQVPNMAQTIISKPKHQLGLTTFSEYVNKAREIANFRNEHDVSLVQIGTLETKETGSMYGKKEGFLSPVRSVYPIVLFNTRVKDMQIVTDLDHAENFLDRK